MELALRRITWIFEHNNIRLGWITTDEDKNGNMIGRVSTSYKNMPIKHFDNYNEAEQYLKEQIDLKQVPEVLN